jgi:hypothetical protein
MAQAPQPPSDFSQYYNLYKERIAKTLGPPAPVSGASFQSTPKEPDVGFLGGLIDFVSRPLYAVTNIADKALELPERFAKGEGVQGVGALAVSPLTGLFAQSRENKNYTSDIIEKYADVYARKDPNYVDTENNVDPAVKGALGFVGDVALDPLAWIPATWIAKGIGVGTQGIEAVKGATKKALGTEKVAEATKGAVVTGKPVNEVIEAAGARQSPIENVGDVVNNNPAPAQASLKAADVIAQSVAKGDLPSKTFSSALRTAVDTTKLVSGKKPLLKTKMTSFLNDLKLEKIVSAAPAPQRELNFNEWLDEFSAFPDNVNMSDVPLNAGKVGSITLKERNLQEFVDKLDSLPPEKQDDFFAKHRDSFLNDVLNPLYQRHADGIRAGQRVDILGRAVPEAEVLDGAAAAVARLADLAGAERANAEFIMGPELFASMRRMSPERMAKFLDASQNVLARTGVVEAIGTVRSNSPEAKLLARFDISPAMLRTAQDDLAERINVLRAGQQTKNLAVAAENVAEDPNFVRQLQQDLVDNNLGADPRMLNDALSGIKNALGVALRNFTDSFLRKKYQYEKYDGELLLTDLRYGAGDARVKDLYGTYVQNDYWTSLSKRARSMFAGFPTRRDKNAPMALEGNIYRDELGNKIYRGGLPKYVNKRNYQAYAGFDIASAMERYVLTSGKAGEDYLAGKGVPITLDLKAMGAPRVIEHLRFTDMYRLLDAGLDALARESGIDRAMQKKWLQLLFFNANSGVSRTSVADALLVMRQGGTREQVLDVLRSGTTRSGGKSIDNWLSGGDKKAIFGHSRGAAKPVTPAGVTLKPNKYGERTVGHYYEWSSDMAAEKLVDAMFKAAPYIDDVITLRTQQYVARTLTEVNTVLPEISRNLVELMSNPVTSAGALRAVNRTDDMVDDYISNIDGTEAASVYLKGIMDNAVPTTVKQAARSAEKISSSAAAGSKTATDKAKAQKAREDRKVYDDVEREAAVAADDVLKNPQNYDPETVALAQELNAFNIANPFQYPDGYAATQLGRERFLQMFNATYRMDPANHISASIGFKSVGLQLRRFKENVYNQVKAIGENPAYNAQVDGKTPVLNAAVELIQKRTPAPAGTVLEPAVADVSAQLGKIFDVTGEVNDKSEFLNTILGSGLIRTGASLDQLNSMFMKHMVLGKSGDDMAKLPESGSFFDADLAVKDAKKAPIQEAAKRALPKGTPEEISEAAKTIAALDQWRTWKIDNPRHFMLATQTALFELATKVSYIDNMFDYAKKIDLATDSVAEAKKLGFVKVVSEGNSYFGGVLPDNMYLAPEIAEILQAVDIAFRTSRTLNGPMGEFTNKYLDKLLNTWKYAVTVIRPGHHPRNEIGGQSLRFAALGTSKFMLAESKAYGLLALRKNYTDVDMWAALRADGEEAIKSGEVLYSGKKFKIDADDAFRRMQQNLFDSGRIAEDLLDDDITKSSFGAGVDFAATVATLGLAKRGGTVEKIALGLSEFIEHKARAAHALQAMMQMADGKPIVRGIGRVQTPKNLEEAWDFAIESALKYHPNAASLTAFETKIPRRLFPFYSWVKPATIALLEASIMNPGRTITAIPKASYNLAIAMGVDPYSMYYPFPEDQMFPSFLTEETLGPQFEIGNKYIALNPGFASVDLYNTFLTNPVEGVLGMTNPFLRVPLEVLAGSRLGSQAPIRDMSDFIDSSIPGVSYVSNITGRSITGGFEPQRQVATGSKTALDQGISAFNFLSGLGARNYSRSSYINFAEIEARNEAAREEQSQSFVDTFLSR